MFLGWTLVFINKAQSIFSTISDLVGEGFIRQRRINPLPFASVLVPLTGGDPPASELRNSETRLSGSDGGQVNRAGGFTCLIIIEHLVIVVLVSNRRRPIYWIELRLQKTMKEQIF